ncbi:MAG: hypothetical protein GY941_21660 [Planctomycetes bacterium]|nr:hypothetical protein [Planctomycetota bacterium]
MGTPFEGVFSLVPPVFSKSSHIYGDVEQPLQGIYEESATQKYALGTKLSFSDGRVFRYTKNGATLLAKARMTSGATLESKCHTIAQTTYGPSQVVGDQEILMVVTTGGTWVENEYAQGFLVVNKVDGIGDMYKVVANRIRSTDTLMDIQLETPLRTTLVATSELSLVKSCWRDVVVAPTTEEVSPAGIPLVDVTAAYYCWLQTAGYAPFLVDDSATIVKGNLVGVPTTDAGACLAVAADTTQAYGTVVYVGAADEAAIVDLKLDS